MVKRMIKGLELVSYDHRTKNKRNRNAIVMYYN